jgi:hypothetical protein
MARIYFDPPRTLSYRSGAFFVRRRFGELLDPFLGSSRPRSTWLARSRESTIWCQPGGFHERHLASSQLLPDPEVDARYLLS